MKVPGKLTKTEWLLLTLSAAFLLVLGLSWARMAETEEGAAYTITTQRQAPDVQEEPEEPAEPAEEPPEESGPVDINTAGLEELDALAGIGPVLAQRIIDYRTEHGPFQSVDELLEVKGIGEKTLEKFREDIVIGAAEAPAGEEEEDAA